MRHYNTGGIENMDVDLDDASLYLHLPNKYSELRDMMFSKIGYVYCYMNYWHNDIFGQDDRDGGQKKRVEKLIKNFTDNEDKNYNNPLWLKEQIFIFDCETENMC